jgi:putative GTP pyrophosphokinase
LRRRFARLAGLLELADAEFMGIRDQILSYQQELPQAIRSSPNQVLVDQDSLGTLIRESELVRGLDEKVAAVVAVPLGDILFVDIVLRQLNLVL